MPKILAVRTGPLLTDEQIASGLKPRYNRRGRDRGKMNQVLLSKRTKAPF
jgi:hypothetical protein